MAVWFVNILDLQTSSYLDAKLKEEKLDVYKDEFMFLKNMHTP